MLGREGTIWVYGSGQVSVRFSENPRVSLLIDGRSRRNTLGEPGWHSLLVSVPRNGLRLESISLSP